MLTTEFDDGFKAFFEEVSQNGHYDSDIIKKAYELAAKAHKNQKRRSGEPYIMHPVAVAEILFKLGMDNECIVAALLHDVVEDTDYNLDYIKEHFGDDVALLVDGVTKLGKIPLSTREEVQAENIRKMFIAMNKDVRVIIIKLADRLHNMRTLQFMPDYKQREKSLETLEIYAPIAHRLGIRAIKDELEDLAVRYLDPIAYKEIEKHQYNPIEYIKSRIKSPESIVKKLKRYGYESSIDNMVDYINDIAGIRIVCSFTSDIYKLAEMIGKQNDLTVVSVKDYIKHPKESGYKSYHMLVTVPIFLSDRVVDTKVEIQIRTMAMDFWASLEHKIYYKFEGNAPQYISRDLRECSEIVSMLDAKMLQLNEAIIEARAAQEEDTDAV